jgi:hypothetical protein
VAQQPEAPETPEAPPSAPSTPTRNGQVVPYTPLAPGRSTLVKMSGQSPVTRGLLKAAKVQFRVRVAIEEAFPDCSAAVDLAKTSFFGAVTNVNAPRRGLRFKQEKEYMTLTIAIVRSLKIFDCLRSQPLFIPQILQSLSQLRGAMKTKAQSTVPGSYFFPASTSKVKEHVAGLLHRATFHFKNTERV